MASQSPACFILYSRLLMLLPSLAFKLISIRHIPATNWLCFLSCWCIVTVRKRIKWIFFFVWLVGLGCFFVHGEVFCWFYYLKKNDSWHFEWYLSIRQMWDSSQGCCFPFFFMQPLLCCAVEREGPDATAAWNTSLKCKSERNATAVPPLLIVSGTLLSQGPVAFGSHPAVMCTAFTAHRLGSTEKKTVIWRFCCYVIFNSPPPPNNFGPFHFSL